jgi:hypothetical protein
MPFCPHSEVCRDAGLLLCDTAHQRFLIASPKREPVGKVCNYDLCFCCLCIPVRLGFRADFDPVALSAVSPDFSKI